MRLLIQPGDGVTALVKAISRARKRVEIVIFRMDMREVEMALGAAVGRGVPVSALIAHTNRAGEEGLRKLEMRLLGAGVTVARTADDLVRYHGKMMLIDRRELYLLGFNFTHQDVSRCRSFGIVTRNRDLVREAGRLFDADVKRVPYEAGSDNFVVSPVNARNRLAAFLQGARKQLLIYDPEVSDPALMRILEARFHAGVDVRIIGKYAAKATEIPVQKLPIRLHTRTIIRDGKAAFLGSQSLRELELDMRREVGAIVREAKVVAQMRQTFESDWAAPEAEDIAPQPVAKVARKIAKAVARELAPVAPVVEEVVQQVAGGVVAGIDLQVVEDAVKQAVKEAVQEVVQEAVEVSAAGEGK